MRIAIGYFEYPATRATSNIENIMHDCDIISLREKSTHALCNETVLFRQTGHFACAFGIQDICVFLFLPEFFWQNGSSFLYDAARMYYTELVVVLQSRRQSNRQTIHAPLHILVSMPLEYVHFLHYSTNKGGNRAWSVSYTTATILQTCNPPGGKLIYVWHRRHPFQTTRRPNR